MEAREVVGQTLKLLREQNGLTQQQVATALGEHGSRLDPTAVGRIEKGTRDVRVDELLALAAALEVSPSRLVAPTFGNVLRFGPHRLTATQVVAWLSGDTAALSRTTLNLAEVSDEVRANRLLSDLAEELRMLDVATKAKDRLAAYWVIARTQQTLAALMEQMMTDDELGTITSNYSLVDED